MSETPTTHEHLSAISERPNGSLVREHVERKMGQIHNSEKLPIYQAEQSIADRRLHDIAKFNELAQGELGNDASHDAIWERSMQIAGHYVEIAHMRAHSNEESDAIHDAREAASSLLVMAALNESDKYNPQTPKEVSRLVERGYGRELLSAAHEAHQQGLVVQIEGEFGMGFTYRPVASVVESLIVPTEIAYGRQMDPKAETFGAPLGEAELRARVDAATPTEIFTAFKEGIADESLGNRKHELASLYLERDVATESNDVSVERIEKVAAHSPEALQQFIADQAESLRIGRSINSPYRTNGLHNIALDTTIFTALNSADSRVVTFAKSLITDRPEDEVKAADWLKQMGHDINTESINAIALKHQEEAADLFRGRIPGRISEEIRLGAETLRDTVWNNASDRRAALQTLNASVSSIQMDDTGRRLIKETVLFNRDESLRLDRLPKIETVVNTHLYARAENLPHELLRDVFSAKLESYILSQPVSPEHQFDQVEKILGSKVFAVFEHSGMDLDGLMKDLINHFDMWESVTDHGDDEIEAPLVEYVSRRVTAHNTQPSALLPVLEGLKLQSVDNASITAIKGLIERGALDKLPTKDTKLKLIFTDGFHLDLYKSVMDYKRVHIEASPDEIVKWLSSEGKIDETIAEQLLKARPPEGVDLTRVLVELKDLNDEHQARERWLSAQYATDLAPQSLAAAWQNRKKAMADGTPDNPNLILKWAAVSGIKDYLISKEDLSADQAKEILHDYSPVMVELARCYPVQRAAGTLMKHIELDKSGYLVDKDLTPGKVRVEVGGRKYEVEWLSKKSPAIYTMGVDTGCCMTLDGASRSCIEEALTNPRYGGMTVRVDGRVRAQSVGYLGEGENSNVLVLDNIEANAGTDMNSIVEVYQTALSELIKQGAVNGGITQINVGEGYTSVGINHLEGTNAVQGPSGVYTDAHKQRVLLAR